MTTSIHWSLVFFFLFILGCTTDSKVARLTTKNTTVIDTLVIRDTVFIRDTVMLNASTNWQSGFNLTHNPDKDTVWGKAVSYYLSLPACDAVAFDFYYGFFRPGDNALTSDLVELILSDNEELRPFYRWCLDMTISIVDGALAEYPGEPARKYVEQHPLEFFSFIQSKPDSTTYFDWVDIIQYSGLHEYRFDQETAYSVTLDRMKAHCTYCPDTSLIQFEQFAKDITSLAL